MVRDIGEALAAGRGGPELSEASIPSRSLEGMGTLNPKP